jgi:DNA-binding MarR family transcriptional regulator
MPAPREGAEADARVVLDAIRRIVRELRESSRAVEKQLGVSAAQLFVLRALAGERALSLKDLAERTMTHQSSVSVVVGKLTDRRLVTRARSASDRRRLELTLTPKARTLLADAPEVAQDRLIAGVERLPPARRRALAVALSDWVKELGLGDTPPEMFFEETPRGHR